MSFIFDSFWCWLVSGLVLIAAEVVISGVYLLWLGLGLIMKPRKSFEIDKVLMLGDGEKVTIGAPTVAGAKVTATVKSHGRLDKVRIVKFRRRKHHRKQMGHRQYYTEIEITGIAG